MSYNTFSLISLLFIGIVALWLIFALIYYVVNLLLWAQYDYGENMQCISFQPNATYVNAFLFALESQTTIGYGGRHPVDHPHCWPIIVIQCFQPIVALSVEGLLVVIVVTRLTDARYTKIRYFVNKCCISERDSQLCLVIRSGIEMHMPDLVGVSVTGKLLKTRESIEGYLINLEERELVFSACDLISTPMPVDLTHIIDSHSPLYELGKSVINHDGEQLEIIMTLTATIESTGAIYQITQSYVTEDILWGERFKQCIFRKKQHFVIHELLVNQTEPIIMPEISQEQRDIIRRRDDGRKDARHNYYARKTLQSTENEIQDESGVVFT